MSSIAVHNTVPVSDVVIGRLVVQLQSFLAEICLYLKTQMIHLVTLLICVNEGGY